MIQLKWIAGLFISVFLVTVCNRSGKMAKAQRSSKVEEKKEDKYAEGHPYGGWFCPDNFGMFPPVDIKDLKKVPVIEGRLPTKEETRSGSSLMHIDTAIYKDARPLDMDLPRLARIHSDHNGMHELIIVIQAVVIGEDSIVGYRFPSGGNGSAWLGQLTFLDEDETNSIGPMPYVYIKEKIQASTTDIWEVFSETEYAQALGEKFNKQEFLQKGWNYESRAHLKFENGNEKALGIIMNIFGNLYSQIDYDRRGFQFTEKMLIMEDPEKGVTEIHVVFGPYPDGIEEKKAEWQKWVEEVKARSEG